MNDELRAQRLAQARELLDKHNLKNWGVDFADLSRVPIRTLVGESFGAEGICVFVRNKILIDPTRLLNHPYKFLAVVRHEVAHALAGPGFGHGPKWLRIARKIGCGKRELSVYRFQMKRRAT